MSIQQNNSAIMSLVYKMIDTYPKLTVFGGVVRDIIAPAFFKGKFPFEKSFKTTEEISDIDMIYNLDEDELKREDKQNVLDDFFYNILLKKLREWDWKYTSVNELKVYGTEGIRINVEHQILDLNTHIDIICRIKSLNKDADVNQLRFNKERGLFLGDKKKPVSIHDQFSYQDEMLSIQSRLEEKRCRMICIPSIKSEPELTVLRSRRFIKMICKGWTIENMSEKIVIRDSKPEEICMICFETKLDMKSVELNCSKCLLCLCCFQTLLERDMVKGPTFKCPTCREKIKPWN